MDNEQTTITADDVRDAFDKRDQVYTIMTGQIGELLGPTTLSALYEFFEVSYEGVSWLEFQLFEEMLMIVAIVTYTADQRVPEIIEKLAPVEVPPGGTITTVKRLLRIGLPLSVAVEPKEEIVRYLRKTIEGIEVPQQPPTELVEIQDPTAETLPATPQEFDNQALSKDQIEQIMFFQDQTKRTRH